MVRYGAIRHGTAWYGSDSTIHFFEDRVETLEVVCADSRLEVSQYFTSLNKLRPNCYSNAIVVFVTGESSGPPPSHRQ